MCELLYAHIKLLANVIPNVPRLRKVLFELVVRMLPSSPGTVLSPGTAVP